MATFISTDFMFNGLSSTPYDIQLVKVNEGGIIGVPMAGGKEINEQHVSYRDKPWFYNTKMQPMAMKMCFTLSTTASTPTWTETKKKEVFEWLYSPRTYCDFKSNDFYDSDTNTYSKLYKIIFTSPLEFHTADFTNGYLELTAHAYPFAYTEVITQTETIASSPTQITINNPTNVKGVDDTFYYYPKMYIDLTGATTSFQIVNTSDSNRVFALTALTALEELYVDNELKVINTDQSGVNRINNLTSKQWFRLVQGNNVLQIYGTSDLVVVSQFPIML